MISPLVVWSAAEASNQRLINTDCGSTFAQGEDHSGLNIPSRFKLFAVNLEDFIDNLSL